MSLDTLLLLRRVLCSQVLNVGDPEFAQTAAAAATALQELDAVIQAAVQASAQVDEGQES